MARVKVKLQDNVARVVFIETDATIGATLGINLFLPDGTLATAATLAAYLGFSGVASSASAHRLLTGLTLGNDHPQYTRIDTLTTRGDLYARGAATVQRLAKGTDRQFLRADTTDPVWETVSPVVTLSTDLSGSVTLTNLTSGTLAATIAANAVTDTKLRDSAAVSVIGRSAASSGDPADIVSAGDKAVLHQNGTTLVLSTIDSTYISNFASAAAAAGGSSLRYVNTSVPGGNTVANTITETAFTSGYTIPAATLAVGSIVRVRAFGVYGTDGAAPTLQLKAKLGTVILSDTTAVTATASLTNRGWCIETAYVVQTIGATGTVEAQGLAELATGAAAGQLISLPNTATITIDTTVSEALTLTAQWGTANANNTIQLRELAVWIDAPATSMPTPTVISKTFTWVVGSGAVSPPVTDVNVRVPVTGTIVRATLMTIGGTGSCVVDVWKDTFANFPPTVADTICAAAKPTIASGIKYEDTTLTGWTTAVTAGDVLTGHLDSSSTFSTVSLQLDIQV